MQVLLLSCHDHQNKMKIFYSCIHSSVIRHLLCTKHGGKYWGNKLALQRSQTGKGGTYINRRLVGTCFSALILGPFW